MILLPLYVFHLLVSFIGGKLIPMNTFLIIIKDNKKKTNKKIISVNSEVDIIIKFIELDFAS